MAQDLDLQIKIRALVEGIHQVKGLADQIALLQQSGKRPIGDPTAQLRARARSARDAVGGLTGSVLNLKSALVSLGAGFALFKLSGLIKESALLAARFETMGIVMGIAGNNAGHTRAQMEALSVALQKSGISMLESREVLTHLATAHIDLTKALELGRAAQDLAVVANLNSSQTFARLVDGIQSGQVEILRTLGLNVSFEASYQRLAQTLGTTTSALTEQQKVMARTNAVLVEAANFNGIYEASMTTAGKQILSSTRYVEDFKLMVGQTFNEALTISVMAFATEIKGANAELSELSRTNQLKAWGESVTDTLAFVGDAAASVGAAFQLVAATLAMIAARGSLNQIKMGRENAKAALAAIDEGFSEDLNRIANNTHRLRDAVDARRAALAELDTPAAKAKAAAAEQARIERGKGVGAAAAAADAGAAAKAVADQSARARLALARATADAELTIQQDMLERQQAGYERALEDRLISVREFYDRKTAIDLAQLDAEIARQQQVVDAAQAIAGGAGDEKDRLRALAELATAEADLTVLINRRGEVQIENSRAAVKAETELRAELDKTRESLLELQSQIVGGSPQLDLELALVRVEAEYQQILDVARQLEGVDRDRAEQLASQWQALARQAAVVQAQAAVAQKLADAQQAAEDITRAGIDAGHATGALTDLEALRATGEANRAVLAQLGELREAYLAMGEAGATAAAQVQAQMIGLAANLDPVADEVRAIFGDAFTGFFESFAGESQSWKERFLGLAGDIVGELQRMFSLELAQQLLKGLTGLFGGQQAQAALAATTLTTGATAAAGALSTGAGIAAGTLGGGGQAAAAAMVIGARSAAAILAGSGAAGGGGAGAGLSLLAGLFHSGGLVGQANGAERRLPAGLFDFAPRFHRGGGPGLLPGEVPAILAGPGHPKGPELVLNRDQQRQVFGAAATAGRVPGLPPAAASLAGPGGPLHRLPAVFFATAARYHGGGLAADEVPAPRSRGGAGLAADDPRRRNNLAGAGAPAPAAVNIRNVNVFDTQVIGDYLASSAGERVILNVVSRNKTALR